MISIISMWKVGLMALRFSGRLKITQVIPSFCWSTFTHLYFLVSIAFSFVS